MDRRDSINSATRATKIQSTAKQVRAWVTGTARVPKSARTPPISVAPARMDALA